MSPVLVLIRSSFRPKILVGGLWFWFYLFVLLFYFELFWCIIGHFLKTMKQKEIFEIMLGAKFSETYSAVKYS